jgi:hypothetical protein
MDGILCNYPLSMCYDKTKSLDETLGIRNENIYITTAEKYENMNMVSYLSLILDKLIDKYQKMVFKKYTPKYEIALKIYSNDMYKIFNTSSDPGERKKLIDAGAKDAIDYAASISENHDEQIALDYRE